MILASPCFSTTHECGLSIPFREIFDRNSDYILYCSARASGSSTSMSH